VNQNKIGSGPRVGEKEEEEESVRNPVEKK